MSLGIRHLAFRGAFGGLLMGLANLVPGISGGTMLLAAGVYPRFITAVAEVTTFEFRRRSLVLLASVVAAAALTVLFFAGPVKDLVVERRWVMYSLFIGLTLGGIPVVWKLVPAKTSRFWAGAVLGLALMVGLAIAQADATSAAADRQGIVMLIFAGVAGASAMILPGVSGGYLWLVLGVYIPILTAIEAVRLALTARDLVALTEPALQVVLPVGVGVVIGVALVSNVLRFVLQHFRAITLGALMGLLIGAVAGLWPFRQGVPPAPGDRLRGQTVFLAPDGALRLAETGRAVRPQDYRTALFTPTPAQVAGSLGLIVAGLAGTMLVARYSRDENDIASTSHD